MGLIEDKDKTFPRKILLHDGLFYIIFDFLQELVLKVLIIEVPAECNK